MNNFILPPRKLYDLRDLAGLAPGNSAFLERIIRLFIEEAQKSIAEIRNAAAYNDLATIAQVAHRLKSSVRSIHIDSLEDVIPVIEQNARESLHMETILPLIAELEVMIAAVIGQLQQYELHH